MVEVGQSYRANGRFDIHSVLVATILGMVAGVIAAVAAWPLQTLENPKQMIGIALAQGLVVGGSLHFVVGRLQLRLPRVLAVIGAVCTLLSIGLPHYAYYLQQLDRFAEGFPGLVAKLPNLSPEQRAELCARGPNQVFDDYLRDRFGHSGLFGSMCHRAKERGPGSGAVWIVWGIGTALAVPAGAIFGCVRALRPFCEACDEWCEEKILPALTRGESTNDLAWALLHGNLADAQALLNVTSDPALLRIDHARATLHECPTCDVVFADIVRLQVIRRSKRQTKTRTQWFLRDLRLSPAQAGLLRSRPALPEVDPRAAFDLSSPG